VAEAAKEGGFLGIGGVPVSDAEKSTLAEISIALKVRLDRGSPNSRQRQHRSSRVKHAIAIIAAVTMSNHDSEITALTDAIARLQHLPPGPREQRGRLLEALARPGCFSKDQWFRL
jgi:hypothetical protein